MKNKYDYTFRALGSLFIFSIFSESDAGLDSVVQESRKRILDFESEFSRFQPSSSLSVLNRLKRSEVTDRFHDLLLKSKEVHKGSEGFFNPLYDVRRNGYVEDFDAGNFILPESSSPGDYDLDSISTTEREVILREGMELDFWAIGKGYLWDLLLPYFHAKGFKNVMLNLWGDIVLTGTNAYLEPHRIGIMSPFDEGGVVWSLSLENASVSSSGSYVRKWEIDGKQFSHIISPSPVAPALGVASVTVVAEKGYLSDAYATALFAAGPERGLSIAQKNGIGAVFIMENRDFRFTEGFVERYGFRSS